MRGAVGPAGRRPPLAVVGLHFVRVLVIWILILGPPVIETRLPFLSHEGDSSDHSWPPSAPGVSPVEGRLRRVVWDFSATFSVVAIIPFIHTHAVTVSMRSRGETRNMITHDVLSNTTATYWGWTWHQDVTWASGGVVQNVVGPSLKVGEIPTDSKKTFT